MDIRISNVRGAATSVESSSTPDRKRPSSCSDSNGSKRRNTLGEGSGGPSASAIMTQTAGGIPEEEECCLCFGPATHQQEGDEKIKFIKNLFRVMVSNKEEDLSAEISNGNIHLCDDCEDRVKELWDLEGAIQSAQTRKLEVVSDVEKTVVDGELLNQKLESSGSANEAIAKLRKIIVEGKLWK